MGAVKNKWVWTKENRKMNRQRRKKKRKGRKREQRKKMVWNNKYRTIYRRNKGHIKKEELNIFRKGGEKLETRLKKEYKKGNKR